MANTKQTWAEYGQSTKFAINYQILMIIPAIILYQMMGLVASTIASLAGILGLILLQKSLGKKKIDPILYAQFFLMLLFQIPPIILNNEFLLVLSEPVSGLIMGFGYLCAALFMKEPMTKSLIPSDMRDGEKVSVFIKDFPNEPLKKIDYIWAAEMILSAATSLTIALLFPPSIWFFAKFIIGPTLSVFAFAACGVIIAPHLKAKPETRENVFHSSSMQCDEVIINPQSTGKLLIHTEYQSRNKTQPTLEIDEFSETYIHKPNLLFS